MPDFAPKLPTDLPVERQIIVLHRMIISLWNDNVANKTTIINLNSDIAELKKTINTLSVSLKDKNGHTGSMPDITGNNSDHDRRYLMSNYVAELRIASTDSPYTIALKSLVLFCDTDGGAITVNLPAVSGRSRYRIINCGSSANDVTLTPDGSDLLEGAAASKTLSDGESVDIAGELTEGWW